MDEFDDHELAVNAMEEDKMNENEEVYDEDDILGY